jgi:autotransporter-associated beta strand protein
MAAAGIGGVQLFMQSDGYLQSEQAWANVSNNITAVKDAGLRLWMADDNGYPSGMAGGRVVEADPAHEARCLIEVQLEGRGTGPVSLALPAGAEKFVHAYLYPLVNGQPDLTRPRAFTVQDNLVTGNGRSGDWTLRAFALQVNNEGNQATSTAAQFQTTGRYPNLLNPAAMEAFVSRTHEEYVRRFGSLSGQIDAFYSNEPNLMTSWFTNDPPTRPGGRSFLPWDAALPAVFQQRHGYDLRPMLPALYGGTDTASKLVRRHFHETVGALLAENFSQRIADWGDQNGIRFSGHPLQEEDLVYHVLNHGDMFRFVEPMQIPAVDLPMPDRGATWNFWMPKFLSSVAQFKNRPAVVGLLDPIIYRPQMELTPLAEDFRRIVNMGVFSGVNQFQTYLFWQLYDPAVYRGMNEYVGRLSLALRGARHASTVGLYYPIETFQANFVPSPNFWARVDLLTAEWQALSAIQDNLDSTARNLSNAGIDFNWVHGDWLRDAVLDGGVLVVGPHRYSTIVLPCVEVLPLPVAEKLEQFRQAGGRVELVERRPELGDNAAEHSSVAAIFSNQPTVTAAQLTGTLGAVMPPDFELRVTPPAPVEGAEQEFFSARFTRDGRRITYLVNNAMTALTSSLALADSGTRRVSVYNPLDGSITALPLPGTVTIAPSSSLLVVENPTTVPEEEYQPPALQGSVVNGDFSDRTGMTSTSSGWFGGFPPGWSGGTTSDYAVLSLNGATYANLGELSSAAPFNPIAQNVGTVEATTDVRLTFTLANLQSGSSNVGVAIYGPGRANLGNASFTNAGTFTHTVKRVAPGTALEIAFWGVAKTPAMGLTGVALQLSESAFGWNGGVGGAWIDGGGGWSDKLDGVAATWSNAKPVIVHFTNSAVGTQVAVGPGGVTVSDVLVSGGQYSFTGGSITMTNTGWSVAAGASASVAGSLLGTGGLTKSGGGALVLSGSNNYSGPTIVESGSLIIDGDHGSILSDVVVRSGATLGGVGVVGRNLAFDPGSGWLFAPGPGLTVAGLVNGGFDVSQVQNLHSTTPIGRYRLMTGAVDPAEFSPIGQDAAMDIGGVRRAWFEVGPASLDLVVAAAAQSFDGWLQQYQLSGAAATATAAPAGDGIPNLLKYAFNLDPTLHEGAGMVPGEYRGLPQYTTAAGSHLEMIYFRDTAKPDIDVTPVWKTSLEETPGWSEVPDLQIIDAQGGIEQWRARIPMDDERGFMKIQVDTR